MKRSDLICENGMIDTNERLCNVHTFSKYGTEYTETIIDEEIHKRCGAEKGRYITLFTDTGNVKKCLTELTAGYLPGGKALVVGFGNKNIGSDSLGARVLRYIPATAHLSGHGDFKDLGMRSVCVLETGVTGKTGMESSSRAVCAARFIGADIIIAIDSLACSDTERLCRVIQLTDAGISPGSGVGNDRQALNGETAGIPVLAIGVPTVIDLDSITDDGQNSGLMVTPRNIDVLSERFAEIIGISVSCALNPTLTEDEIRSLLIL